MKNFFLLFALFGLISCGWIGKENDSKLNETKATEAEFPGGKQALYEYIASEVSYPAACKEQGIHGKVYASFVVNAEGEVEDVTIKRNVHPLLDAEVVRVLSEMPAWEPATLKGRPVKSRFNIPVNFKLEEENYNQERQKKAIYKKR